MADLEARLHRASMENDRDSLEALHARKLVREGYLPGSALSSAEAKMGQARLEYASALRDRDVAEADLDLRRMKLRSQLRLLRAPPSELRSAVTAVVKRVQRTRKGGMELVTFTLQRL
jgi:hypothetical protein